MTRSYGRYQRRSAVWWLAAVACLAVTSLAKGDVVLLKDGTRLNGRVLAYRADTLTLRTSFGAEVRIPRAEVLQVSFVDSLAAASPGTAPATSPRESDASLALPGKIAVTFIDGGVSSKIAAKTRGDRSPYIRANGIEMQLVVDDVVVHTQRDTTMDKTIYNGPERIYKNSIELEDFDVDVPGGYHHALLVVKNVGGEEFRSAFDTEPLEMSLNIDNMMIPAGKTVRVKVGITRGRLRLSKPKLYRIE